MKVDVNSWVGRLAWSINPSIQDECSLFRALLLGLLKRFFFNCFLPLIAVMAVVLAVGTGIEVGHWPAADAMMNAMFVDWLMEQYWWPIRLVIALAFGLACLLTTAVPAMIVAVCGCITGYLIFKYVICWPIKKLINSSVKVGDVATTTVIARGISNAWNKLCRPIEVINSKFPSWLVDGQTVIIDNTVEGVIRDIDYHGSERVTFKLRHVENLLYAHRGWDDFNHYSFFASDIDERVKHVDAQEVK